MNRRENLDILRTFAVSTVLLQHLAQTINVSHPLNSGAMNFLNPIGHSGVLAFFVHTSLVLMYSLDRLQASAKSVVWRFYVRRWFRIYPLAIASIALVLIAHVPSSTWKPGTILTRKIIIANLFLVQNVVGKGEVLGPLWSLPYEVQMYVVLPILFFLAIRRKGYMYIASLLIASWIGGAIFHWKTGHLNLAAYIPCFLSGVLCYALRKIITPRISAVLWPLFLLVLICSFCAYNGQNELPSFGSGWVFCIVLGLGINLFHNSKAMWFNHIASTVALYSYSIYLLHIPILYLIFLKWKFNSVTLAIATFLIGTALASFIAFNALEVPFINLGQRWSVSGKTRSSVSKIEVLPVP
jgi:peptidoglycan/LPS O-acetylase OafA/YrhL